MIVPLPALRPGGLALALGCALLLLAGCGADSDSGSTSAPEYAVIEDSGTAAQEQLDKAEDAFDTSNGRYLLTWQSGAEGTARPGKVRLLVDGRYDAAAQAAAQKFRSVGGDGIETLLRQRDVWGKPVINGEPKGCWIHIANDVTDLAASGVLPAVTLPLGARALGFLEDDEGGRIVAAIPVDSAVATLFPRIADSLTVDPDATVPGLIGVSDGRYYSTRFAVADLLTALEDANASLPDELRSVLAEDPGDVSVSYSPLADPLVVSAPPARKVVEAGQLDPEGSGPKLSCSAG